MNLLNPNLRLDYVRLGGSIDDEGSEELGEGKQTTRLLGDNKPPEFHLYSSSGPFSHTPNGEWKVNKMIHINLLFRQPDEIHVPYNLQSSGS
jgi:hypothetical protein